jgi:hypothetical protein
MPTRRVRTLVRVLVACSLSTTVLVVPVIDLSRPAETSSLRVPLVLSPTWAAQTTGQDAPAPPGPGAAAGGELSSGVHVGEDFDVLGVTWDAASGSTVDAVEVRLRQDGEWTEWFEVDVITGEGPDPGTAEHALATATGTVATEPVIAAGADGFEVRLDAQLAGPPEGLEAVLVDSDPPGGTGIEVMEKPLAAAEAAEGGLARPAIVTRAQWGADESKRNCPPSYSPTITNAVIHHTAGSNAYTRAQASSVVNGIYAYHTDALGWCDIGYQFLVDKYGTLYEGRYGGVNRSVMGAHAGGFNRNTFGVSLMGNYDLTGVPAAAVTTLGRIVAWKLALHDVDPRSSARLTSAGGGTARWPAGTTVTMPAIMGHRDVGLTACPGRYGYALLPALRATVDRLVDDGAFVQALYHDLLQRPAEPQGHDAWTSRVGTLGKPPAVAQFASSRERQQRYIDAAYRRVLGRPADPSGLQAQLSRVQRGSFALEDIDIVLLSSTEFWSTHGGTPEDFIEALYVAVLDRPADPAGMDTWPAHVTAHGRSATVKRIYASREAVAGRVDAIYRDLLDRPVDPAGLASWIPVAQREGDHAVRDRVLVSAEYQARALARF